MSEGLKYLRNAGYATVIALGLSACGNEARPDATPTATSTSPSPDLGSTAPGTTTGPPQTCTAVSPESWGVPPNFINPQTIANKLHLTFQETVRYAVHGAANCPEGITPGEIEAGASVISIPEMGGPCVVVGLPEAPQAGKIYHDVAAVCVPIPNA